MTTNTHGGPRPKVRDDDGRGKHHSPKPGSGRTPQSFTLKLGESYAGWHGKVWTVIAINRTAITLQSTDGDKFTLFR